MDSSGIPQIFRRTALLTTGAVIQLTGGDLSRWSSRCLVVGCRGSVFFLPLEAIIVCETPT